VDGDDDGVVGVVVFMEDDCALAAGDDRRGRDGVGDRDAVQPDGKRPGDANGGTVRSGLYDLIVARFSKVM